MARIPDRAAAFPNTPPLLGDFVRIAAGGTPHTLGVRSPLCAIRATPGRWTLDYLTRVGGARSRHRRRSAEAEAEAFAA